jgi:hypothetical protein
MSEPPTQSKWERLTWIRPTEYVPPQRDDKVVFKYRLGWPKFLIATAATAVATWFCANLASSNDRALSIEGVIHLSPFGATVFWWVVAAVCGLGTLMFLYFGLWQVVGDRRITLDEESITFPTLRLSRHVHRVRAIEITSYTVRYYRQYTYLTIWRGRRLFTVNSRWLPVEDDIVTIIGWLKTRCPNLHATELRQQ